MSRADNRNFLINIVEYLLGATDVAVIKVAARKRMFAGKKYKFKARVKNNEHCCSPACEVRFYLSRNDKLNVYNDVLIGSKPVPEIAGKRSKLVKLRARAPEDLGFGSRYVLAVVCAEGFYMETDSSNDMKSKKIRIE